MKIVGGHRAKRQSWPAHAYVYEMGKCGGTLIGRDRVLTAAHCFSSSPRADNTQVVLGAWNLNDVQGDEVQWPDVHSIHLHSDYSSHTQKNDIALLILRQYVRLTEHVQLACLGRGGNNGNDGYVGSQVGAAGWGATSFKGSTTDILLNVFMFVQPQRDCKRAQGSYYDPELMLCASSAAMRGGKDTCQGDSGGGLYAVDYIEGEWRWSLIGVVSHGNGCGDRGKPGVYTRVSKYKGWIFKF